MAPSTPTSKSASSSPFCDRATIAKLPDKDLYDLLGVPRDAGDLTLEWSYRHPDKDNNKICATYEVLGGSVQKRNDMVRNFIIILTEVKSANSNFY